MRFDKVASIITREYEQKPTGGLKPISKPAYDINCFIIPNVKEVKVVDGRQLITYTTKLFTKDKILAIPDYIQLNNEVYAVTKYADYNKIKLIEAKPLNG